MYNRNMIRIMKFAVRLLACLCLFVTALSCTNQPGKGSVIGTIDLGNLHERTFSWETLLGENLKVIELQDTSKEYSFMEISKLVCWKDRIYISDWKTRRIIIFGQDGQPVSVLNRRGRGSEEYLQVSDFDVDDEGGIWVLDGQKDVIVHYSSEGKFLSQSKTGECQYSYISFDAGKLLLGVALWDKTENGDFEAVLADTSLNVLSRHGKKLDVYDPEFEFPNVGFSKVGKSIMLNMPIDDYVSVFEDKKYKGDYFFDFGGKRVPDEIRKAVMPNMKNIVKYSFLVNCSAVVGDVAFGTMMDCGTPVDFIVDMKKKEIYKQPVEGGKYHLVSISGDKIILSGIDEDSEHDVIAVAPVGSMRGNLDK